MSHAPLDQDRLDRMRTHVLGAVDADVRERGRRGRRLRTGLVAACGAVVLVGVGPSVLGTGTVSDSLSAGDSAGSAEGARVGPSDAGSDAAEPGPAVDADREVVVTGSATVRVTSPDAAADRLARWVGDVGGRVDQRSESGTGDATSDDPRTSVLTVRVPAGRVDTAVEELRGLGSVEGLDVGRDDVTAQVADLDARIRSLTVSVERLRGVLADAADVDDVIAVERSLSERQAELESLQAQRRAVGDQVALATLTVTLVASDGPAAVEPGGFVGGLRSGWDGLAATVNVAVRVVGVLLPWTAVGAVLWAAWRLVHRRGWSRAGRVPPG